MSTLRIALIVMPIGVVLFVAGMFGAGSSVNVSMATSGVGGALLLVGLGMLLWNLRYATFQRLPRALMLFALIAAVLHGYEHFYLGWPDASIGWLIWPMLGYLVLLFVGCISRLSTPATVATIVLLLVDLGVHYDVFVAPKSSTAALALLFIPIWNILLFGPVAFAVAWLFQRSRERRRDEP